MKIRVLFWWDRLRTSFWFLPGVMAIGTIACVLLTLEFDRRFGSTWEGAWWLYGGNHEGARGVLSVVASSMITVAGVVFSIMMVVLSLAAQQYGPRLLRNFMRDRISQVVLGFFVATFLYCLLVLRTVRGGDTPFVPQISVTLGILLSVASLSLLIYFVHHVSVSIHIGEIISRVQSELLAAIDDVFPEMLGEGEQDSEDDVLPPGDMVEIERDSAPVNAKASGYLEAIDDEKLLKVARRFDLVVQLNVRPGDYIIKRQPVMWASPLRRVDDDAMEGLRDSLLIGSQRTPVQDVLFALQRQADIAVRALSPGINDPLTAIDSLEHLAEALYRLADRRIPSAYRFDRDGRLRIVAPQITFNEMLECSLGLVRQYGVASAPITIKILDILGELARHIRRGKEAAAVREQLDAIAKNRYDDLAPRDRERVQNRQDQVGKQLDQSQAMQFRLDLTARRYQILSNRKHL
jgi:uncharacterized membrane protein